MSFSQSEAQAGIVPICPVSGSTGNKFLCAVEGFNIWRCPHSATDFVWPMPTEHTLKTLYDRKTWFEGGEKGGYRSYDSQTEPAPKFFVDVLSQIERTCTGRSVLDIGCGYGTHLALAAQRGWKCFGVEVSEHARRVAKLRHGNKIFVVDCLEGLLPHEFDLIALFDVIEHLTDPYDLFYKLFSKGAIGPQTTVVITTPNARSCEAMSDPAGWVYRHPPSHLTYYSAESLHTLLTRLHFPHVEISGLFPLASDSQTGYGDERSRLNDELTSYGGLLCKARGSDFKAFMHERYVPGTWSKVTEYEHMPRYLFAKHLVAGARVLDFGCGTGYGAAILAEAAVSVVGLDIDDAALEWARGHHDRPQLRFEKRSDLGAGLSDQSFDVITCFEMIEHVNEAMQIEVVQQCRRLLGPGGRLIISTPNPEVTRNYGENPFHLREMNEHEFGELLRHCFKHVMVLKQWIRPSVSIDLHPLPQSVPIFSDPSLPLEGMTESSPPLAYVAICSDEPVPSVPGMCYLDSSFDSIAATITSDKRFSQLQLDYYQLHEQVPHLQAQLADKERELLAIKESKLYRLQRLLRSGECSFRHLAAIARLLMAIIAPALSRRISGMALRLRRRMELFQNPPSQCKPYEVRVVRAHSAGRPRVVHALANFKIGGSSRLVVDLVEHVGHQYEQEIVTKVQPDPPSYSGVMVHEYRSDDSTDVTEGVFRYLREFNPSLCHIHYWGESDKPWYEAVMKAAEQFGCQIVENINTPVTPYWGEAIARYVYVSDYVLETFGQRNDKSLTIYPGSDLSLFSRKPGLDVPDDCIGMVYRLEGDKLTQQSIDVFIEVVKRRPNTRVLIVGGGTFLKSYKRAVRSHGVMKAFRFTSYVAYEDLPALYRDMSVFVAPVWKESFGHVSVLAMNCGIPVVGYDVGALAEIIGNRELLAPPGDSDRLADIIVELLQDREKRLSIGLTNQKRAQALFSVGAMIIRYGELYESVLRQGR
jgi:2-polyprenyl-3-methyl-5-hydroxy-6-metoxy-1,4-benzoquinol methylase/glycosyltransferase involved in cell wall biosynthesis